MNIESLEKLVKFFEKYKLVSYSKGKTIIKPGDRLNYIGFIKEGFVRMYLRTDEGKEITLHFFKPIFWMTQILAMTGEVNKYYFEALTPVKMYTAPIKETMDFLKSDQELSREIMKNVLECFLDSISQLASLLVGDSYTKVASMASLLSERSNNRENKLYSQIDFGITHKLIAGLTGLTRETVTLQMLKLEKQGLIENRNRKIIILDEKGLAKAARATEKS